MATPVAHFMVGTIVLSSTAVLRGARLPFSAAWILGFGLLGCLPDFDMVLGLVVAGDSTAYHFGPSHSLAFAALAAAALALYWYTAGNAWAGAMGLAAFLAVASHVLIDWTTGPRVGDVPSRGLAALWPFLDQVIKTPVTLFKGVDRSLPGGTFSVANLRSALLEAMVLVPIACGLAWLARKRSGGGS